MLNDFINPPHLIVDQQLDLTKAKYYQNNWSKLLEVDYPLPAKIKNLAGVDLSYDFKTNQAFAVAVVLDAESLELIEIAEAKSEIRIPYQPGFLSFRELPLISFALAKLKNKPDLIIADGQGIAHPRRFGLASHLGLAFNIPTIGCGKSRLYGKAEEPGNNRGDFSYLYNFKNEVIGLVLRTRAKVKPLYISVGHKANLEAAKEWILKLAPQYRLPLTTKLADNLARLYKEREIANK